MGELDTHLSSMVLEPVALLFFSRFSSLRFFFLSFFAFSSVDAPVTK